MIYQSTKEDGSPEWIYFDGQTKQRFATEAEARIAEAEANQMEEKQAFVRRLIALMTTLAQSDDTAENIQQAYFARGYNDGGITNEDVQALGLTAADVGSMIGIAEGFHNWLAAEGRRGVLSKVRIDV